MPAITFIAADGKSQTLQVEPGQSVMHVAVENDIRGILADCGGSCSCATCHVFIDDAWAGKVPARTADETELVEQTNSYRPANSRLSCQVKFTDALDGIVVTVAPAE